MYTRSNPKRRHHGRFHHPLSPLSKCRGVFAYIISYHNIIIWASCTLSLQNTKVHPLSSFCLFKFKVLSYLVFCSILKHMIKRSVNLGGLSCLTILSATQIMETDLRLIFVVPEPSYLRCTVGISSIIF